MSPTKVLAVAGSSSFEVEEPDLIIYRLRGTLQAEELRTLRDAEWPWNEGKPFLLVMLDIRDLDGVTMAARRASMEPGMGTNNRAMGIFGGSWHIRTLTDLVLRGVALVNRGGLPMRSFNDEPAAREWLYSQRAVLSSRM